MAMPMGDLLRQIDMPNDAKARISALLSGCGFAEAIDAAMLDDDLIASIAESNDDIRHLTLLWHSARPLIDGWAKGVTKFGLGRRVEEGGPGGPHGSRAAPAAVEPHDWPRASPAAVPVGVEPVVGTAGSARASRLLRGFTRNNLRKFKNPRPTPPRPRVSMAEIEANRIEGAKGKIHAVTVRHFPTCRRLRRLVAGGAGDDGDYGAAGSAGDSTGDFGRAGNYAGDSDDARAGEFADGGGGAGGDADEEVEGSMRRCHRRGRRGW